MPFASDQPTMTQKRSPDISLCSASRLGASELVLCRSDQRYSCDYAQPFGVQHFCIHPQSLDIAADKARPTDPARDKPLD